MLPRRKEESERPFEPLDARLQSGLSDSSRRRDGHSQHPLHRHRRQSFDVGVIVDGSPIMRSELSIAEADLRVHSIEDIVLSFAEKDADGRQSASR